MFTKYYGEVDALVAKLKSFTLRLHNKYKLQEKQIGSNLLKNILTGVDNNSRKRNWNKRASDRDRDAFKQYLEENDSLELICVCYSKYVWNNKN